MAFRNGDAESAHHLTEGTEGATMLAIRAMAQHQLEHYDAARRALARAGKLLNTMLAGEKENDSGPLTARILVSEAENLINGQAANNRP